MVGGTLTRRTGVDDDIMPLLDRVIPRPLREEFEQRYWRPIEVAATLERFVDDPEFTRDPHGHVALFADHGIVHVRDVAGRLVEMAEALNGALLPDRSPRRLDVVTGVGVLTAYLHDIGMVSATPQGRRAHPQFAAREPFRARFDDLAAAIWAADVGGIRSRIVEVGRAEPFPIADQVVLREILATAMAHSKTAVPMAAVNDRHELQARLRRAVIDPHPMDDEPGNGPTDASRWYGSRTAVSFDWLTATATGHRALADDVVDAIRLLRAADALRQRGTTLRTSAGYEIFVDQRTGMAIYGLRTADRVQSFYVLVAGDIAAGEANVRAAELSADGRLTFSFHQGGFEDDHADRAAARAAARVIADIWADVVPSFERTDDAVGLPRPTIPSSDLSVVLLAPGSTRPFVDHVADELSRAYPHCVRGLEIADEPTPALLDDHDWSERGVPVEPDATVAARLIEAMHEVGWRTDAIDRTKAFHGVRHVTVDAGETVIVAGSEAKYVLVPMQPGLRVDSLGGFKPAPGRAWVPVGVTGVVRRAERNAGIVAETALDMLVIPADVFLREWFRPYTAPVLEELRGRMAVRPR